MPLRKRSRSPPSGGRGEGTPDNPGAWLVATGRNRAIDRLRRERILAAKTRLLEATEPARSLGASEGWSESVDDTDTIADERLELLFTCCHPALATEAQVASPCARWAA